MAVYHIAAALVSVLMTTLLCLPGCAGQQTCDRCNCQISSLTNPQAIYTINLICNTGTITWFGATGAIRLELTPFLQGAYRACFLADSDSTQVKVSHEVVSADSYRLHKERSTSSTSMVRPAGVKEHHLKHLMTANATSREFCIHSQRHEPLLLYIESIRISNVDAVPKIIFHYDMEKMDKALSVGSLEECRPCTKEEVLDAYCSMDFAVIGSLADVVHNTDNPMSTLTLSIKQVIHQREADMFRRVKRSDRHLTGHVTVPKQCKMQSISSDLLMTGRKIFNRLQLKCATYLHDWRMYHHEVECSHDTRPR
ncbi:unnamed protein product [Lymnaea stagnalis]|uniref:Uncharacterized protein n=1 Tax=Lymnaea stagnalis TaxID=6523 RepID=A0AAV2HD80_LYMST